MCGFFFGWDEWDVDVRFAVLNLFLSQLLWIISEARDCPYIDIVVGVKSDFGTRILSWFDKLFGHNLELRSGITFKLDVLEKANFILPHK